MADPWDEISVPVQQASPSQRSADPWDDISTAVDAAPQRMPGVTSAEDYPAVAMPNEPEFAKAQTAPAGPPSNIFGRIYQSFRENDAARKQGAAPMVRDRKGNFVRKPIGEIEEYDAGPMIRTASGVLAFNPKTDVMLRDPQSGKLIAFERSEELDGGRAKRGGFASKLLEGFAAGPVTAVASSNAVPMAVQRGAALGFPVSARTYQAGERARDAAAFNALDTPVFAPAFRSKGAARFARTVEEMPVMGGIVKNPKTETEQLLANAQARIAADLGAASTSEQAGRVLQGGLDRFRTAGTRELEPGVLTARGVQPRAPGRYVGELVEPLPGSVGQRTQSVAQADGTLAQFDPSRHIVVRDAGRAAVYEQGVVGGVELSKGARQSAEAAQPIREALGGGTAATSRGTTVQAARPLNETRLARRGAEDMTDAELRTLIRSPARDTSFATRQEALYEAAHRQIPRLMKVNDTANPNLVATPNAGAVAAGMMTAERSARISGGVLEGRFGQLVQDLTNARSNFTLDSLKAAKTEVGRALASFGNYDARLDRTQLKALYRGLSSDYEAGLQTLANRAYERTTLGGNRPDAVTPEVARAADRALYEMRRADRYTRLSMERMDRFTKLLNAESPEAAVRTLATRMKEGTIDRGMIRAVADALRPEERNQVLGHIVAQMGKRPGAKEAEHVWNLHTFATDWNKNKVALGLMTRGVDPSIRQRLDALAQISERMKYYENTKNFSGTAYAGLPFIGLGAQVIGGGASGFMSALVLTGGSAAAGKFLTTPRYLDWMVKAAQSGSVPRAGGPQVGGTHLPALMSQLEKLAANDNELGPIISQAITLMNKRAAAGEDEQAGPEGQQRQSQ